MFLYEDAVNCVLCVQLAISEFQSCGTMATDDVLRHNQDVLDNLKPGDLVKFDRDVYHHWAVYIGKFMLILYTF